MAKIYNTIYIYFQKTKKEENSKKYQKINITAKIQANQILNRLKGNNPNYY